MTNPAEPALRDAGLEPDAAGRLAALARPCVHLVARVLPHEPAPGGRGGEGFFAKLFGGILGGAGDAEPAPERPAPDADISVGASKAGGAPDLPEDAPWPEWNGAPLSFLLQIDLRGVAGMPGAEVLPDAGLLSFFYAGEQQPWGYDPADRGGWRVLHTPPDVPLRRHAFPPALARRGRYAACALDAEAAASLPYWEEPEVESLALDEGTMELYCELPPREGYDEYAGGLHQLLGWPAPVQSTGMGFECEAVSRGMGLGGPEDWAAAKAAGHEAGAAEWRLLLQVDSHEDAGMQWGDLGRLYFWIRASDLAARRWENVWMILQCG